MRPLGIIEVDQQIDGTLLINFSDGTFASFTVDDLARLRPHRVLGDGEVAEVGQDYM